MIFGAGSPSALQFNVAGSLLATIRSAGCSVIMGAPLRPKNQDKYLIRLNSRKLYTFTV